MTSRWSDEAHEAADRGGWRVVHEESMDDWSGAGALVLCRTNDDDSLQWGVLVWSYGSCSGCDEYEERPRHEVVEALMMLVVDTANEEESRRLAHDAVAW